MDNHQSALALLRRLDLTANSANVVINDSMSPSVFTVVVFSPERKINPPQEWNGHPVRIIFAGGQPVL